MSSATSDGEKLNLVHFGLALAILLVLIAAVIGISFLGNPYYAIAEVLLYALLVTIVALRLRNCLRLAKDTVYEGKLKLVAFALVLAVFAVVARLGDIIGSENRDYIRLATGGAAYLALFFALGVVEDLLRKVVVKPQPADASVPSAAATGTSAPS